MLFGLLHTVNLLLKLLLGEDWETLSALLMMLTVMVRISSKSLVVNVFFFSFMAEDERVSKF